VKTVFVGLSGGVDSSVTALLLKQQGYRVVGVYMKNWSKSLPGFNCPWKEDYQDAKRVAVQLKIDFLLFDFEQEYQEKVVNYMIEEYKIGRTPNPDITCNQEIKFKLFAETAFEQGADLIATGHYANTNSGKLFKATDQSKDQTYFLYRVSEKSLQRTVFPLGNYLKPDVRKIANENNLVTSSKKESMGICFVGKVGIKEFLSSFVKTEHGPIIDQQGMEIGRHDGAIFYTIGQRHGLEVGGGLPYYVTGKNMATNEVFVTSKLDDQKLWANTIQVDSWHWINDNPSLNKQYMVRYRHLGPLEKAKIIGNKLFFENDIKAINPGQSVVLYEDEMVLGGGIVTGLD
jgi:tRNA-specific 2-thiouridylase